MTSPMPMTPSCKKLGATFWATVVMMTVILLYPLSQGPVLWLYIVRGEPLMIAKVLRAYRPIYVFADFFPKRASEQYSKYCSWWIDLAEQSPSRKPLAP